jgi:hypothetical protein
VLVRQATRATINYESARSGLGLESFSRTALFVQRSFFFIVEEEYIYMSMSKTCSDAFFQQPLFNFTHILGITSSRSSSSTPSRP